LLSGAAPRLSLLTMPEEVRRSNAFPDDTALLCGEEEAEVEAHGDEVAEENAHVEVLVVAEGALLRPLRRVENEAARR